MTSSKLHKLTQDDTQTFKEEQYARHSMMNIRGAKIPALASKTASCPGDLSYGASWANDHSRERATPLDTIAEVACSLGTRISSRTQCTMHNRPMAESAAVAYSHLEPSERGSDSPTSIPTQEPVIPSQCMRPQQAEKERYGTSKHFPCHLRVRRSSSMENMSSLFPSEGRGEDDKRCYEILPTTKGEERVSNEMKYFKDDMTTHFYNLVQEMDRIKAHVVSLQNKIERMESERCHQKSDVMLVQKDEGCAQGKHTLILKSGDLEQVCFTIRLAKKCHGDDDRSSDQELKVNGNVLRISMERKNVNKDGSLSNELESVDVEKELLDAKKGDELESERGSRKRVIRDESMPKTNSGGNSENSDWCVTTIGNKRMKLERGNEKPKKGKGARRKRDNWTAEENELFMGTVLENKELEEMTLRRMLARMFSPRRTHEQCANHLRILRSQKKLPPAKEEGATKRE